jgi:hypothetical protein
MRWCGEPGRNRETRNTVSNEGEHDAGGDEGADYMMQLLKMGVKNGAQIADAFAVVPDEERQV